MSAMEPRRGDYVNDPGPEHGTRHPCPVDNCDWYLDSAPVNPYITGGTLADVFGFGTFAVHAVNSRAQEVERVLAKHLRGHEVVEWVLTVERLRTAAGEKR